MVGGNFVGQHARAERMTGKQTAMWIESREIQELPKANCLITSTFTLFKHEAAEVSRAKAAQES
jgi:hypothetical protein